MPISPVCMYLPPTRQVYWNSRLEAEHLRLVNTHMQRGQVRVCVGWGLVCRCRAVNGLLVTDPPTYTWHSAKS